ncbi:MAG: methylated-DNA--[protein]-cysteine S-methyltransferase [Bacillota bacterium]|nr:methylated-DNA--[protein]-cysteine S-methyltransferase [Bacillota bacterium]
MLHIKDLQTVYWTELHSGDWQLFLAATTKGLCFIGSGNEGLGKLTYWAKKQFPGCPLMEDDHKLEPYAAEIVEYLEGQRRNFTIPIDFHGTPFQLAVWDALCKIPYGQTKVYMDIASHINKPKAIRAVGAAIGANPVLITIPCHRVIGKNGALTGYRGGLEMKRKLLELEQEEPDLFKH